MPKTKIAAVQMDVAIGDVAANRTRIIERLKEAAEQGAQLAVFPECALTGYCFDSLEEAIPFAETADGESATAIAEVCRATGTHTIIGFIEKARESYSLFDGRTGVQQHIEEEKYYNAAMLISPQGLVGTYRKVHLPFIGADRFLTPGNRPFEAFKTGLGKIGINICYDINFPEGPRALKLDGAELFVLPTNWPTGAWRTPKFMLNARAQENHYAVVAVNRVGTERGWRFIGQSKIVDCMGDVICEAGEYDEAILYAEVDIQESNNNKIINVKNAYELDRLGDRRPEFYSIVARDKEDIGRELESFIASHPSFN